jgi:phosphatidylinositol 4-kinase
VISLLRDAWSAANLELYVFPYGVIPTGYERGIIEVVPASYSRNELGQQSDGGMLEMFQQLFGEVRTTLMSQHQLRCTVSDNIT